MSNTDDFSWFYDLTPEEQDFIMRQAMYSEANLVPYSFGGATSPDVSETEFDLGTFGGGLPPELDKEGEVQPWGLDQEAQAVGLQKNRNTLIADAITGAFGGAGAYSPTSFAPTETYGGPQLETPGRQQAEYYAGLGGGGWQSAIAEAMLAGEDASRAVADIIKLATLPDSEELPDDVRAQRDAIIGSLYPNTSSTGGGSNASFMNFVQQELPDTATEAQKLSQQYDLRAVVDFANGLGAELAKDPDLTRGFQDPNTGLIYANPPETEWPEPAQKYMSLGLPFPTDRYSSEDYLSQVAPLYEEEFAAQAARNQQTAGAQNRAHEDFLKSQRDVETATQAWDEFQRQSEANMPQPIQGRNFYNPGTPATWDRTPQPGSGQTLSNYTPATRERYNYADASSPQVQAIGNTAPGKGWSYLDAAGKKYASEPGVPTNIDEIQPYVISGDTGNLKIGTRDEMASAFDDLRAGRGVYLDQERPETAWTGRFTAPAAEKLTQGRVTNEKNELRAARKAAIAARQEQYAAGRERTTAQRDRLRAAGTAMGMERSGRTPLADALLRRLMVSQQQGLYGRY